MASSRAAAALVLLAEAARLCQCQDASGTYQQVPTGMGDRTPPSTLNTGGPLSQEVSPGVMQWILAVILSTVLGIGLVRVYRVLRKGENMPFIRAAPEGMRPVECGACRTVQYATAHGRIFICFSCRSANRVPLEVPLTHPQELVEHTGPLRSFEFKKGGENFWQELKVETLEEGAVPPEATSPSPATNAVAEAEESNRPVVVGRQLEPDNDEVVAARESTGVDEVTGVPQCVICLDKPGRMVVLPCAHGGVCEECVTRIAQNRATGGAHCPHCRSQIQTLVKLHEINGDLAKGIEYRIPIARIV